MGKIKADSRDSGFGNEYPLATPRGRFFLANYNKLGKRTRSLETGVITHEKQIDLSGFESGYNLEDFENSGKDLQGFYSKKGMDYVSGVLMRARDVNVLPMLSRKYREAVKFRDSYQ